MISQRLVTRLAMTATTRLPVNTRAIAARVAFRAVGNTPLSMPQMNAYDFSTAATQAEPAVDVTATTPNESSGKKKARRRTVANTDPIIMTERAASRVNDLLSGESAEGAIGIRLGVRRRGCNGLSYTLNYAFETPAKDIAMETHGIKVFIEPMALFNIVGTVMDWEETELTSEFTFNNPNSKGECGCGESFNV